MTLDGRGIALPLATDEKINGRKGIAPVYLRKTNCKKVLACDSLVEPSLNKSKLILNEIRGSSAERAR
jgi:hypothetical protein